MLAGFLAAALFASPTGGAFSGPATPNGSSVYWNPAAMAAVPGNTFVNAELTGILYGVTYQREAEDPTREPRYKLTSFWGVAPDFSFNAGITWPSSWVQLVVGGYSPAALGSDWPEDGPQRYHGTNGHLVGYAALAGAVFKPHDRFAVSAMFGPAYYLLKQRAAMDFGAYANSQLPPGSGPFATEDPQLQGWINIEGGGLSTVASFGAWGRPLDSLKLGVGLLLPQDADIEGTVNVDAPPALAQALPDYKLAPKGKLTLRYPAPWTLSTEAELTVGRTETAVLFQWAARHVQRTLYGTVTEASPKFIEGRQVSVKHSRDDWLVGARVGRRLDDKLRVTLRFDIDPRYIPREAISAVNLDFTTFELSASFKYEVSPGLVLVGGYDYVYLVPIHVTHSLFSPSAPSSSGLQAPSGRGTYDGFAHKVIVGVETVF